jgi:hypothetical protein
MNVVRARALWKKALPFLVAAMAVGAVGTVAAKKYLADDCCYPGSPCCYPGSPCCHHADGIAKR